MHPPFAQRDVALPPMNGDGHSASSGSTITKVESGVDQAVVKPRTRTTCSIIVSAMIAVILAGLAVIVTVCAINHIRLVESVNGLVYGPEVSVNSGIATPAAGPFRRQYSYGGTPPLVTPFLPMVTQQANQTVIETVTAIFTPTSEATLDLTSAPRSVITIRSTKTLSFDTTTGSENMTATVIETETPVPEVPVSTLTSVVPTTVYFSKNGTIAGSTVLETGQGFTVTQTVTVYPSEASTHVVSSTQDVDAITAPPMSTSSAAKGTIIASTGGNVTIMTTVTVWPSRASSGGVTTSYPPVSSFVSSMAGNATIYTTTTVSGNCSGLGLPLPISPTMNIPPSFTSDNSAMTMTQNSLNETTTSTDLPTRTITSTIEETTSGEGFDITETETVIPPTSYITLTTTATEASRTIRGTVTKTVTNTVHISHKPEPSTTVCPLVAPTITVTQFIPQPDTATKTVTQIVSVDDGAATLKAFGVASDSTTMESTVPMPMQTTFIPVVSIGPSGTFLLPEQLIPSSVSPSTSNPTTTTCHETSTSLMSHGVSSVPVFVTSSANPVSGNVTTMTTYDFGTGTGVPVVTSTVLLTSTHHANASATTSTMAPVVSSAGDKQPQPKAWGGSNGSASTSCIMMLVLVFTILFI